MSDSGRDYFKQEFKFYKRKYPPPLFDNVVDFDLNVKSDFVQPLGNILGNNNLENSKCHLCDKHGLQQHRSWGIYSLSGKDGFIFIKNPFTVSGQQDLIRKCLENYSRKPSVTNLVNNYPDLDDVWSTRNCQEKCLDKLCWATLGYHHNWNTKEYDRSLFSSFPSCLKELSQHIAACLNFTRFNPEAAIVNYYHLKSSLSIHNDHSEEELEEPIISFSLGQTGVFLIGTENKFDKPAAMFLRSGDIVIMSGPCRLSYHAVPCIVTDAVSLQRYDGTSQDWLPFLEYIKKSRINISVRQVYKAW